MIVVGRMKPGPEKELFDTFADRFGAHGRSLGLAPIHLTEIEEKRRLSREDLAAREGEKILEAVPAGAKLIVLDERGKSLQSTDFARTLAGWRDEAAPAAALVIGGAGGLSPYVREKADLSISFGRQTWPHMLARVMLAEQLYRAATILSGHPYHRDG